LLWQPKWFILVVDQMADPAHPLGQQLSLPLYNPSHAPAAMPENASSCDAAIDVPSSSSSMLTHYQLVDTATTATTSPAQASPEPSVSCDRQSLWTDSSEEATARTSTTTPDVYLFEGGAVGAANATAAIEPISLDELDAIWQSLGAPSPLSS
jgi:hypothetical protein